MKKVFKYGTGDEIPGGAVYLCTQVETATHYDYGRTEEKLRTVTTNNMLVWHYFLVEVKDA